MKIAYFDCGAGASGDMILGALLDAASAIGEGEQNLLARWRASMQQVLAIEEGGRVQIGRVQRGAIDALKVDFFVGEKHADDYHRPHSHSHSHAHGHHQHHDDHHHAHSHRHDHSHDDVSDHHHHHGHVHHDHRALSDIKKLLADFGDRSILSRSAVQNGVRIFEALGRAEAKVHGIPLESVYFHEVGAYDSIMDIVGIVLALELLQIGEIRHSPVTVGTGFVHTAHGTLPVPPPAVVELLREAPIALSGMPLQGECLTPTGAAVLAVLGQGSGPLPAFDRVLGQGHGAGNRNPEALANVVRLILGEAAGAQ